jgi:hypothetical protein
VTTLLIHAAHAVANAGRTEPAPSFASIFSPAFTINVANANTNKDSKTAHCTSLQATVDARLPICPDCKCRPVCESTTKTLTGLITCDMKVRYSQYTSTITNPHRMLNRDTPFVEVEVITNSVGDGRSAEYSTMDLLEPRFSDCLRWSSGTWSTASWKATVGLDHSRTRTVYRFRLVDSVLTKF